MAKRYDARTGNWVEIGTPGVTAPLTSTPMPGFVGPPSPKKVPSMIGAPLPSALDPIDDPSFEDADLREQKAAMADPAGYLMAKVGQAMTGQEGSVFDLLTSGDTPEEVAAAAALESRRKLAADLDEATIGDPTRSYGDKAIAYSNSFLRAIIPNEPTDFFTGETAGVGTNLFHLAGRAAQFPIHWYGSGIEMVGGLGQAAAEGMEAVGGGALSGLIASPFAEIRKAGEDIAGLMEQRTKYLPQAQRLNSDRLAEATSLADAWRIAKEDLPGTILGLGAEVIAPGTAMFKVAEGLSFAKAIPRIIGLGMAMGLPENTHESLRETDDFIDAMLRGTVKTSVEAYGNLATAGLASPAVKGLLDKVPVLRGALTQALFTAAGGAYSAMGAMWAGRELVGEEMTPGQAAMAFGMGMFDAKLMQAAAGLPGRALSKLHAAIDPDAFAGRVVPTEFDSIHLYLDNVEAERQAMRALELHNVSTAAQATLGVPARPNYTQLLNQLDVNTLGSGSAPKAPRKLRNSDLKRGEVVTAFNYGWLDPALVQKKIDRLKLVIKAPGGDVPANHHEMRKLEWQKTGRDYSAQNIEGHVQRLRGVVATLGKAFGTNDSYVITDALAGTHKEPVKILTASVGAHGKPVTVVSVRQSAMFDMVKNPDTGAYMPVFNYQRFGAAMVGEVARGVLGQRMAKLTPEARSSLNAEYNRQMALVAAKPQLARAMNLDGSDTPPTFDGWLKDNVARAMLEQNPEVIPTADAAGNPLPPPSPLLELTGPLGQLVGTMRNAFTSSGLDMPFDHLVKAMHFGREKEIQIKNIKSGANRVTSNEPAIASESWSRLIGKLTPDFRIESRDVEAIAADRRIPVTERNALLDTLEHFGALRTKVGQNPTTGAHEYVSKDLDPGFFSPVFDQFRQFREVEAAQRAQFGLAEKFMNKLFSSEQTPEDRLALRTNKYGWGTKSADFIAKRVATATRLSWATNWFKNIPQMKEYAAKTKAEVTEKIKWNLYGKPVFDQVAALNPSGLADLAQTMFDSSLAQATIPDTIQAMVARGADAETINAYKATQDLFLTMRTEQHANEAADLARRAREEKWKDTDYNRLRKALAEKYDKMRDVSYTPRMRFGDYRAIVRKTANQQAEFHAFETPEELAKFIDEAQAFGRTVSSFQNTPDQRALHDEIAMMPYSAFKEVQKTLFEKYKVSYADQQIIEELAFATSSDSSFAKSLLKRDFVPGWSTDILRTIATHTTNFANHMANSKFGGDIQKSIASLDEALRLEARNNLGTSAEQAKRRTELLRAEVALKWMKDHREESFNAHKDFAKLGSFLFFKSLAADLPNAIATLQQIPMVVAPRLKALFGDDPKVWEAITSSAGSVGKKYTGFDDMTPFEQGVFDKLKVKGALNQGQSREIVNNAGRNFEREAAQIAAAKSGSVGAAAKYLLGKSWNGAYTALTFPMHAMETGVREMTALAATRLAVKTGMPADNVAGFVERVLTDTNYDYHRTNRPLMYANRGNVGALRQFLGLFRTYVENTAFQVLRPTNVSKSIPALLMLGGLRGLPGAQDAAATVDMANMIGDAFSDDKDYHNSQLTARKLISDATASPRLADLVLNGISREGYGVPSLLREIGLDIPDVDMSSVAQLGSIVQARLPETLRGVVSGKTDELGGTLGLAGAPASYFISLLDAGINRPPNAIESLAPDVVGNAMRGVRRLSDGYETNRSGVVTERYETPEMRSEAVARIAGFASTRENRKREELTNERERKIVWGAHKATILDKGKKAYQVGNIKAKQNPEDIRAFNEILLAWNRNPKVPPEFKIKPEQLNQALQRTRRNAIAIAAGLIDGDPMDPTLKRLYEFDLK